MGFASKQHKPSGTTTVQRNQNKEQEDVVQHQKELDSHPDQGVEVMRSVIQTGQGDGGIATAIQPKLTVGQPGDKYEKEADETAERVMMSPTPDYQFSSGDDEPAVNRSIQLKSFLQRVEDESSTDTVQTSRTNGVSQGAMIQRVLYNEDQDTSNDMLNAKEEDPIQKKDFLQTMRDEIQESPEEDQISKEEFLQTALYDESEEIQKAEGDKDVNPIESGGLDGPDTSSDSRLTLTTTSVPMGYALGGEDAVQTKKEEEPASKAENKKGLKNITKEREKIQLKADQGQIDELSDTFEGRLKLAKQNGRPLPKMIREEMEARFGGVDFSNIIIHTDEQSHELCRQINARAFANGNHIFFNQGQFDASSRKGKELLAHELTHTIQQGASGKMIQAQFDPPDMPQDQNIKEEDTSKDGSKADKNTKDHVYDEIDPDDVKEKENEPLNKEKASDYDSDEAKGEQGEMVNSGDVDPVKNRPNEQKENVETSKKNILSGMSLEPESKEGEEEAEEEPLFNLMQADNTRVEIANFHALANTVPFPQEPDPVVPPDLHRAKDSGGNWLPMHLDNDMMLMHLSNYAQALREAAYRIQIDAYEEEVEAFRAYASIGEVQERIYTGIAYEQGAGIRIYEWQDYNDSLLKPALSISEEKANWTEKEVEKLGGEADGQLENSENLVSESTENSKESKKKTSEEKTAKSDGEDLSSSSEKTADSSEDIFTAFSTASDRANDQLTEVANAHLNNTETGETAQQMDTNLEVGRSILASMREQNALSQEELNETKHTPSEMLKASSQTAADGDELLKATHIIEDDLHRIQREYYSEMSALPTKEQAEKENKEKQKTENKDPKPEEFDLPDFTPAQQMVFQLADMTEEEQETLVGEMSEDEYAEVMLALEELTEQTQAQEDAEKAKKEKDANAGNLTKTDKKSGRLIINLNGEKSSAEEEKLALENDIRVNEIGAVESNRSKKLRRPMKIVNRNYTFLTKLDKKRLDDKMAKQTFWHKLTSIKVSDVPDMLVKMFSATAIKESVVNDVSQILTGTVNLFNIEAWKKDPLGNLLENGADISEGLTKLLGKGIIAAAAIWAIAAISIPITWGFSTPIAMPIMGWMVSVMSALGTWAYWTGIFAMIFNILLGFKHTTEAGAAKDSEDTLNAAKNAQNDIDGFLVGLGGVGIGKFGMNPAAAVSSMMRGGLRFLQFLSNPVAWAGKAIKSVAQKGLVIAGTTALVTMSILRGVGKLYKLGAKGMRALGQRIKNLFKKRKKVTPDVDELPLTRKERFERRKRNFDKDGNEITGRPNKKKPLYNQHGERIMTNRELRDWKRKISRWRGPNGERVKIVVDKYGRKMPDGAAAAFDYEKGIIYLRSRPTRLELFHETRHAKQWIEVGKGQYQNNFTQLMREEYVFREIMRHKDDFSPAEILRSQRVIHAYRNNIPTSRIPRDWVPPDIPAYTKGKVVTPTKPLTGGKGHTTSGTGFKSKGTKPNKKKNSRDTMDSMPNEIPKDLDIFAITKKYKNLECMECAQELVTTFKNLGIKGDIVDIENVVSKGMSGNIWSDTARKNIATNGKHRAVMVNGKVYDNVHKHGIQYQDWVNDIFSPVDYVITKTPF